MNRNVIQSLDSITDETPMDDVLGIGVGREIKQKFGELDTNAAKIKNGTFYNENSEGNWYRVASINITGAYKECLVVFKVNSVFESNPITEYGILTIRVRLNSKTLSSSQAAWEYASEALQISNFVVTWDSEGNTAELWLYIYPQWCSYTFTIVSESMREKPVDLWQIHNNVAYDSHNDLGNTYHPDVGKLQDVTGD